MIKRKIVLYVALFAIILGGGPYFTGQIVETKFQDVTKMISEFDPLSITILEYHRGWRKSTAKTRVVLKGKLLQYLVDSPNKEVSVILEHEIRHGPFVQVQDGNYRDWRFALALVQSKLFLTEEARETLKAELGATELFNIHGEISIEGAAQVNVDGKVLNLKEHKGTDRVAWQGMQGEWHISRDMKHLTGTMHLAGFDFDWNGRHYFANNLDFKTDRSKTSEGLWLGKGSGTLQNIQVKDSQNQFMATGVILGGQMDTDNGKVDSSGTLHIDKLTYNNKNYGTIEGAASVKNLEAKIVKTLYDLSHQAQTANASGADQVAQNILAVLPQLLKSRPQLNVDSLIIHTDVGILEGVIHFAIGGSEASDMKNPQQLIQSIDAKTHFTLPKPLVREWLSNYYTKAAKVKQPALSDVEIGQMVTKEVEEEISKQIKEGYLVDKDPNFEIDLEFVEGKLKVNGQIMQVPPALPGSH